MYRFSRSSPGRKSGRPAFQAGSTRLRANSRCLLASRVKTWECQFARSSHPTRGTFAPGSMRAAMGESLRYDTFLPRVRSCSRNGDAWAYGTPSWSKRMMRNPAARLPMSSLGSLIRLSRSRSCHFNALCSAHFLTWFGRRRCA